MLRQARISAQFWRLVSAYLQVLGSTTGCLCVVLEQYSCDAKQLCVPLLLVFF